MESTPKQIEPQQYAKAGVLLGLALYFAYCIITGNLTNYINYRFTWLAYVATAIFAALGLVSAWEIMRPTARTQSGGTHSGRVSWTVLGVLGLPLALGLLLPSQPLGAEAVGGNISTSIVAVNAVTQQTGDPLTWNVLDWLRAFNRSDDLSSFNGSQADVIGFIYREPSFPEDHFMVARFTISCCVADSSAIGLPVIWEDAPALGENEWVRVQGSFQLADFRDSQIPVLNATSVEIVEQPKHPYLYP